MIVVLTQTDAPPIVDRQLMDAGRALAGRRIDKVVKAVQGFRFDLPAYQLCGAVHTTSTESVPIWESCGWPPDRRVRRPSRNPHSIEAMSTRTRVGPRNQMGTSGIPSSKSVLSMRCRRSSGSMMRHAK